MLKQTLIPPFGNACQHIWSYEYFFPFLSIELICPLLIVPSRLMNPRKRVQIQVLITWDFLENFSLQIIIAEVFPSFIIFFKIKKHLC